MRKARIDSLPNSGVHEVYVSNLIHRSCPEMDWEAREVLRLFIFDEAELNDIELLHWSITPRSYRLMVRCDLSPMNGKGYNNDLNQFYKSLQQRYGYWVKDEVRDHRWSNRTHTHYLSSPQLRAASAFSCDAMPLVQSIAKTPSSYFFSSFWHTKSADSATLKSMRRILNMPKQDWKDVKKRYQKIITAIAADSSVD